MDGFWIFALFAGIPIALGAVMSLQVLGIAWGERGSAGWPTVEGYVTSVEIGSGLRHYGTAVHRRYTMLVRYRYAVDGESFGARQLWQAQYRIPPYPTDEEVFGGRYAEGQKVAVYYHPTKPERSLIEPNSASRREIRTVAIARLGATVFVVVAIAVILRFY